MIHVTKGEITEQCGPGTREMCDRCLGDAMIAGAVRLRDHMNTIARVPGNIGEAISDAHAKLPEDSLRYAFERLLEAEKELNRRMQERAKLYYKGDEVLKEVGRKPPTSLP